MDRSSSSARSTGGIRRLCARGLAVAALAGVAMLGNLRSQASEAAHAPTAPDHARTGPRTASRLDIRSGDADGDELRLVPAIYAWNPDVRFVYFRHVSKWM